MGSHILSKGGQEAPEGPQKGCPNLGSILRPKMAPKQGGGNDNFGVPASSGACPNPLQAKLAPGTLRDLNFHRFLGPDCSKNVSS